MTLNCVSNPVGGNLIGNAWWSGVRVADLLREAGVQDGADAVLQTSDDGWTCGTPLSALTDGRNAMLTVAMNGEPLPIEHGFPVRTLVPGLYGYVSACKWVVDWEVTTLRGHLGVLDPARLGRAGAGEDVVADRRTCAAATSSSAGVRAGRRRRVGAAHRDQRASRSPSTAAPGSRVEIGDADTIDSWVQWATTLDRRTRATTSLRVRATDNDGEVQTGAEADVLPDGATGLARGALQRRAERRSRAASPVGLGRRGRQRVGVVVDDVDDAAGLGQPGVLELARGRRRGARRRRSWPRGR